MARTSWVLIGMRCSCCRRRCRDWLPEDHLAWWVIDAVGEMDLSGFYGLIGLTVTAGRRMSRR